ncbi:MAG: hypothetical protein JSS91_14380 [Bacteroidetes bacterium]|nr:hypothetical protein [Bacteroidota bacterium]
MKKFLSIIFFAVVLLPAAIDAGPVESGKISQNVDPANIKDTLKSKTQNSQNIQNDQNTQKSDNQLPIDTSSKEKVETYIQADTVTKIDSSLIIPPDENTLTNTRLFIYILLSLLGLGLFFFIFVINLFKTFHKKRSTRQSLLLSWNLFFIVSIVWIFIIWGIVAAFWTAPSFMIVMIFLFIISLIMTIIAVKSK